MSKLVKYSWSYGLNEVCDRKAQEKDSRNATGVGKRKWRTVSSQLASNNIYSVLYPEKPGNKLISTNTTEKVRDIRHTLWPLREVAESRVREAGES